MSMSTKSQAELRNAILEMTKRFITEAESRVTDFHFQVNNETGNLVIFDDDDNELSHVHIPEWENLNHEECNNILESDIRMQLIEVQKEGVFDNMNVVKPYSCLLVDEDKETIVDLLYIDDETYIISDELLKGLDRELDDFLQQLLEC